MNKEFHGITITTIKNNDILNIIVQNAKSERCVIAIRFYEWQDEETFVSALLFDRLYVGSFSNLKEYRQEFGKGVSPIYYSACHNLWKIVRQGSDIDIELFLDEVQQWKIRAREKYMSRISEQ